MAGEAVSLKRAFEGWEGHQLAERQAVVALTPEQLAFRPRPDLRSMGELVSHISFGRLDRFHRMGAQGS